MFQTVFGDRMAVFFGWQWTMKDDVNDRAGHTDRGISTKFGNRQKSH